MLNLKALLRREDRHSIHLRLPKFCAITHPFPQHLNEMSGLTNKEYEDRERTIAQFTAVVRDLNEHRARGRERHPEWVIAESITLDDSSKEDIHPLSVQVNFSHTQQIDLQRVGSLSNNFNNDSESSASSR